MNSRIMGEHDAASKWVLVVVSRQGMGMFSHRALTEQDLERVFSLTREGFVFRDQDRDRLIALWTELLRTESCRSVGVEDRRRPPETRLVGFGLSVYATQAFTDTVLTGRPFVSRAFLEEWEAGRRPFLTTKEVADANAGDGLNLLVLHYGWCKDVPPEETMQIQVVQTERFIHEHTGYLTKEYIHEVFGAPLREFMLGSGMLLHDDHRAETWRSKLAHVSEDDWPYLFAFGAEASRAGTLTSMFRSKGARPQFGFSPGEQKLLLLALEGRSDEELATALDLSAWTVKKRWQTVYAKVDAADPSVVSPPQQDEKSRQRRRFLLAYLREHLEELRPFRNR